LKGSQTASDTQTKLFGPQNTKKYGWPLAVGIMVLASFLAMGVIWHNVDTMEKVRRKEQNMLMDNIAQTGKFFWREGQADYFYRILTLLTRISFIENLGVYQNGRRILQAGNGEPSRMDAVTSRSGANTSQLFLNRNLLEDDPQAMEIRAIFSLREVLAPKRAILLSFTVSALLLIAVSVLSYQLYFYHRRMMETERIKAHMISSINHDASHDLTIIHAKLLQVLKRLRQPQKMETNEKDLKNALESTESMVRFLNNLKDQKRLGTGNIDLIPENVDLARLAETVADSFREKLSIREMKLTFLAGKTPMTVWADPQMVKRVLMNLIHNAVKYSPPGSTIGIVLERWKDSVRLLIRDQGVGMDKNHWDRIFEPYWQVNPNSPGIGLGLYISRQLIRISGGELGIEESCPGQGTTFYFTLPEKFVSRSRG
jgi:signal transduction histidine kinase